MDASRKTLSRVGAAAALALGMAAHPLPSAAQAVDEAAGLVGALHAAFGEHHARAVHAKGVILEGSFAPTGEARSLSTAPVFSFPVPVTVRFSDFTGLPDIPDAAEGASPRGFAVKFRLADGSETDVVAHSFNGFPVATALEFGLLLRAIAASGPDAAKPTALDRFLAAHPAAKTFLTTQKPPPASFATAAYYGVNAVTLTDAEGSRVSVRHRFVPTTGESYLDPAALRARKADYLAEEIATRVAGSPIRFDWFAQLAGPGDKADDPSVAWPDERRRVKLGTISIDRMAADQVAADKGLLFMPGNLPPGMEAADPMLAVRNAAYPISFGERQ